MYSQYQLISRFYEKYNRYTQRYFPHPGTIQLMEIVLFLDLGEHGADKVDYRESNTLFTLHKLTQGQTQVLLT